MTQTSVDRRRHPRVKCNLSIRVRRMEDPSATVSADSRREVIMTAVNVSQGGLGVRSMQPVGSNELYRISIDLPGRSEKVTAFGEVIWSDHLQGGIHFLAIHEDQESHLRNFVTSQITA